MSVADRGALVEFDKAFPATAYLLLVVDTREHAGLTPGDYWRRCSVSVFSERHPTLPTHVRTFEISSTHAATFEAACRTIRRLVDGSASSIGWVRPLLDERTRGLLGI